MLYKIKIFILFTLFITLSCDNDYEPNSFQETQNEEEIEEDNDEDNTSNNFEEALGDIVSRQFIGQVLDDLNQPLNGVEVTIGNKTEYTDNNGIFTMLDVQTHEFFSFIRIKKDGYITNYKTHETTSGINKVSIKLKEETTVISFNSNEPQTITTGNGAIINLNGEYIDVNNNDYTGNINIVTESFDLTNNHENPVPSFNLGKDSNNNKITLQPYGILYISLSDDDGNELNIKNNSTSEIKIPIDGSLIGSAPNTIPLWHFNENLGYWVEDGIATLDGNYYVGTVSHFSYWAYCFPVPSVNFCVKIKDHNDNNISNVKVQVTSQFSNYITHTNNDGIACFVAPKDFDINIYVYNHEICGDDIVYSSSHNFTSDNTEVEITLDNLDDLITENISGSFIDCNGNLITNGYVRIKYGDQYFYDVITSESEFNLSLIRCSDTDSFSIEVVDFETNTSTTTINYLFTTPQTYLGNLYTCNSIEEFISFQIDDNPPITITSGIQNYLEFPIEYDIDIFIIELDDSQDDISFGIRGQPSTTNPNNFNYYSLGVNDGIESVNCGNWICNGVVKIPFYGNTGEFIDINFNIRAILDTTSGVDNISRDIKGVIHIIKDF